jgi:hypothetical protein
MLAGNREDLEVADSRGAQGTPSRLGVLAVSANTRRLEAELSDVVHGQKAEHWRQALARANGSRQAAEALGAEPGKAFAPALGHRCERDDGQNANAFALSVRDEKEPF